MRDISRCASHTVNMMTTRKDIGPKLLLRRATAEDATTIFEWQISPGTRDYARDPTPPTLAEHLDWFSTKLASPDTQCWVALRSERACGFVRLDRSGDEWEVSIVTAPQMRGQGLGKAMLAALKSVSSGERLVAEVLPGNEASHALFRAAGFRLCADGMYRRSQR
jgi:UDP-2,4-diacetamido-2,4,6-trideoxy-beta-L-altropyranose hydrolase